jgi:hypothetical protein
MSQLSADRKIASAKSETVYGTDAIDPGPPSAYQAFRVINITPVTNMVESPRATMLASGEKHCMVKSHTDVAWEMPFTGRVGAAGTAPAWDALMLAAGFKKTTSAGVSVAYKPNTQQDMTDTPSATFWQYEMLLEAATAYLKKARGYRGNVTLRMTIGEEAVISGQGMALYDDWPDTTVAKPTAPTAYEGADCMVVTQLVLTVGGTTYEVESLEIQSGWQLTEVRTGEAGKGTLAKVLLTRPSSGGRMTGSMRLVSGLTALQDLIGKWRTGAQVALAATLTNGTKTIAIAAPAMQFGQPAGAAEGVLKYDVPLFFNRGTSGDDELVITLT